MKFAQNRPVKIVMLGAGGTGGHIAPHLYRLLYAFAFSSWTVILWRKRICHLMVGGLLVYIILYYRLTSDIARILCDYFERLSVYKFCGRELQWFHQVVVLGIRKPRGDGVREVPGLLQQVQGAVRKL